MRETKKEAEKTEDVSAYSKVEQLLEEKTTASKDRTFYLNDGDMKTILKAAKKDKNANVIGTKLDMWI